MTTPTAFDDWFEALLTSTDDQKLAFEKAYQQLVNANLISKVQLHRYMCTRGCQIAVVFKAGTHTLCAVRDYELSPGLNERTSVAAAREKRTIDRAQKHWHGRVFDVSLLHDLDSSDTPVGIDMTCRHFRGVVPGQDMAADIDGTEPGHPNAPTILPRHAVRQTR